MTVHDAVVREEPGLGAWVELIEVRFPCDQNERSAGSSHYQISVGASALR